MAVELIDPEGLPEVGLYRQVSIGTGSRLVFLAGQVAIDAEGAVIGLGDLAAQVEQAYVNVGTALAAAGATFDDVVKLTAYFVDYEPGKMPLFVEGISRAAARLGIETPVAPLTGIGVAALAAPDLLVEIEATAVLD
ncbi:RidA family protein [Nocardioides sp. zg-DK7169]|uniref:RidA family protein n=1 Tax=Nocardioides sp. zg-DK7169 TaxID=2736600 RepID=UPI001555A159|nr:Rid family hydrolase [Nocardioides sp. zg-DK7169]NPC98732.1 RidA family protein [Nocardioides sp. zg-DK7169]